MASSIGDGDKVLPGNGVAVVDSTIGGDGPSVPGDDIEMVEAVGGAGVANVGDEVKKAERKGESSAAVPEEDVDMARTTGDDNGNAPDGNMGKAPTSGNDNVTPDSNMGKASTSGNKDYALPDKIIKEIANDSAASLPAEISTAEAPTSGSSPAEPSTDGRTAPPAATTQRLDMATATWAFPPNETMDTTADSTSQNMSGESQESSQQDEVASQAGRSRAGSSRAQTPVGQKRKAAGSVREEPAKKAKTDAEEGDAEEETIESVKKHRDELRNKGNRIIVAKNLKIEQLEKRFEDAEKRAAGRQAEVIALRDELETMHANQKAAREETRKRIISNGEQLGEKLWKKYSKELEEKRVAMHDHWHGKVEKGKENNDKLQATIKELKAAHKTEVHNLKNLKVEEVRKLKEVIKEANKGGGAKAREILKEKEAEMKGMEGRLEAFKIQTLQLQAKIRRLEAENNVAKEESKHHLENWSTQCKEMNKLESQAKDLKHQYDAQKIGYKALQIQYQKDLEELEKVNAKKLKEVSDSRDLHYKNQQESMQRTIAQQRIVFPLKTANANLIKEKEALANENRALKEQVKGKKALEEQVKEHGALKEQIKDLDASKDKQKEIEMLKEKLKDLEIIAKETEELRAKLQHHEKRFERSGFLDSLAQGGKDPA